MKIRELAAILGLAAFTVACAPAADETEAASDEAAEASEAADSEDEEQGKGRPPGA